MERDLFRPGLIVLLCLIAVDLEIDTLMVQLDRTNQVYDKWSE